MGFEKIMTLEALLAALEKLRQENLRVVFTNGCFDLLHPGHVLLLAEARALGDRLVVGLNDDESVRLLKGPKRPILQADQRAMLLAHLECVDFVVLFSEPTPFRLIQTVRPDVLIKGADWGEGTIVGEDFVEGYGGKVVRLPLVPGLSTSALVEKIRAL